jgi:hypothetical protein
LDQLPARPPQAIDGAVVGIRLSAKTAESRTAKRALDAFGWIRKPTLQPLVKSFIVQADCLGFGQDSK